MEKEGKKILDPNSIHTQPRQENSEKKKNQKIKKKTLSGIIFSKNGNEIGGEREKKF